MYVTIHVCHYWYKILITYLIKLHIFRKNINSLFLMIYLF